MSTPSEKLTPYWFAIYLLAAMTVLGGFILAAIKLGPAIEQSLLEKLFSPEWQIVATDLIHRVFAEEFRALLVTSGFGLAIVLIGLTLFPLKEKLSATYDDEAFPEHPYPAPPPFWRQGLEELKLAGLYLLILGFSFYLTLQGFRLAGLTLSIGYLIFAMALDHCAPFFQRRGKQIHEILWLLLRYAPLRTLLLGLTFIGPVILLEKLLPASLPAGIAITLLVLTEVLGMACATLAACHLGSRITSGITAPHPRPFTHTYRTLILLLTLSLTIFYGWWLKGLITHAGLRQTSFRPAWQDTQFKIRDHSVRATLPIHAQNHASSPIAPSQLRIILQGPHPAQIHLSIPSILPSETATLTLNLDLPADFPSLTTENLHQLLPKPSAAFIPLHPPLSRPILIPLFGQPQRPPHSLNPIPPID